MRRAQCHSKEEEQEGVRRGQKSGVWLSYSYSRRKKEVPRLITPSGLLTGESDRYDFGEEVRWLRFLPLPEGTIRDACSPQPTTDCSRDFGFSAPSVPMSLRDFSGPKATISNSVSHIPGAIRAGYLDPLKHTKNPTCSAYVLALSDHVTFYE